MRTVVSGGHRRSIAVPTARVHMMQAISATKTVVAGAGNSSERYADSGMSIILLLGDRTWSDSEALQWERVRHAWSEASSVLACEFDTRHPLRLGAGSRGVPTYPIHRPEHQVHAAQPPQAVGPPLDRRHDLDPVAGPELERLRSGPNE